MIGHLDDGQLAAYALDAMAADEHADVAAHLADCPACRRQLDEWTAVTARLAHVAPPVQPPAGMRERVLARATATPRLTVASPARRRDLGWAVAVAATAVVAIGLGVRGARLSDERARLQDALAALETRADSQRVALAARDSLLARVLGPETQMTTLTSTEASASLRVYWDRNRNEVIVAARRLPPAAAGRTYQLWGIGANGTPVGLGTFNTAVDGSAVVVLALGSVPAFSVTAVTLEPAGGSPGPTTTPLFVGPWPG